MNTPATIETDALVIGAGPAGLFLAFELGLLEVGTQIVDSLPLPGGQCVELYPDKPIYDIPGLPRTTGRALVASLLQQIEPFDVPMHLGQELASLHRREDGRFEAETAAGRRFLAKTVFIAGGAGSFQPRLLKVAGIERFAGSQLFYRQPADDAPPVGHVIVVGGGDEALRTATTLALAGPAKVTLLHRRDVFDASGAEVARFHAAVEEGRLGFMAAQVVGFDTEGERLARVELIDAADQTHRLPVDRLLVFQGLSPRLGPIADWGLKLERRQVAVDTARFETSVPGLFAIGDVVTYPGKKKLILSGFHEATLAAFAAVEIVRPEERVLLQYTTTSPKLHRLLKVDTPSTD